MVAIVKKIGFAAAHYFYLPELSEAENFAKFGKTSNRLAHGHNYELEVTVTGPMQADTGMVMNLKDLKKILKAGVVEHLDFKNLNKQIPYFETRQPTLENLAVYVWNRLKLEIDCDGIHLAHLRIFENEDMFVDYDGNLAALLEADASEDEPKIKDATMGMTELTRQYDFCAGHRLHNPDMSDEENRRIFGKCNNPNGHGHNYTLWVTVKGVAEQKTGMIVDMLELDNLVKEHVLDVVDHRDFNRDVSFMKGEIPTAENIVMAFWKQLAPQVSGSASLHRLRLQETRHSFAEYMGPGQ